MIYFIHDEQAGAVKIGRSDDPNARLRQLQTGNARRLTLIGVIEGDIAEELKWHRRHADRRLDGEWFAFNEDDLEELKAELGSLGDGGRALIEKYRATGMLHPELSCLTSLAVGFPCSVYWLAIPKCMGGNGHGGKGTQYQVMRQHESPGPGLEFWRWHLWARPQWFDSPEEACVHFVASHRAWVLRSRDTAKATSDEA